MLSSMQSRRRRQNEDLSFDSASSSQCQRRCQSPHRSVAPATPSQSLLSLRRHVRVEAVTTILSYDNDDLSEDAALSGLENAFSLLRDQDEVANLLSDADHHYGTILHYACDCNRPCPKIVTRLLTANPDSAFETNHTGDTPLHDLCRHRPSLSTLELFSDNSLFSEGVTVGCTPLYVMIHSNPSLELVQYVVNRYPAMCLIKYSNNNLPLDAVVSGCGLFERPEGAFRDAAKTKKKDLAKIAAYLCQVTAQCSLAFCDMFLHGHIKYRDIEFMEDVKSEDELMHDVESEYEFIRDYVLLSSSSFNSFASADANANILLPSRVRSVFDDDAVQDMLKFNESCRHTLNCIFRLNNAGRYTALYATGVSGLPGSSMKTPNANKTAMPHIVTRCAQTRAALAVLFAVTDDLDCLFLHLLEINAILSEARCVNINRIKNERSVSVDN